MKFFAIHIADLESERFLSASNIQIATWLFLHAYCSKQCNSGVIPDARSINERFWSRHGIDKAILDAPSPLWIWDKESLVVEPFDIDGQTLFEKKSKGGKEGADKRWNRTPNGTPNGSVDAYNITQHKITKHKITKHKKKSSNDDLPLCPESIQLAILFKSALPKDYNLKDNWKELWSKSIQCLIDEGRDPDEIDRVIRWTKNEGCWWNTKIMSPLKLSRPDKDGVMFYDRLKIDMESDSKKQNTSTSNIDLGGRVE